MKKLMSSIITIAFIVAATAIYAQDSNFTVKAGAAYPDAPDKVGFDSAAAFNLGVDKYFTLGVESGFGWVKWKESGNSTDLGNLNVTSVEKTNLYSVPLLATATVRLADMMENYGVMPYITGGAGYSWTWFRHPDFKETFHGFTWQVMGGAAFKLGSDSDLQFVLEAGYRGAAIENADSFELDMSGFAARAGVSFPLVRTY
jgi:outer membrane protein W